MAYTVLARKYRSQTFDEVIGQDPIARTLKNAIKTGKVAHAYLFTGTRGIGKTTMARVLAKALNCLAFDAPTTKPCCECESCIAVNGGEDIDVIEIDGASNRGIENIPWQPSLPILFVIDWLPDAFRSSSPWQSVV